MGASGKDAIRSCGWPPSRPARRWPSCPPTTISPTTRASWITWRRPSRRRQRAPPGPGSWASCSCGAWRGATSAAPSASGARKELS